MMWNLTRFHLILDARCLVGYRHTHFIALRKYCGFYKLKTCGNSALRKSVGTISPTAFAYFVSVSHCSNSRSSSDFFIIVIICYGDL